MIRLSLLSLLALTSCTGGESGAQSTLVEGPAESQGPGKEPTQAALGGARDTLVVAYAQDAGTMLTVVAQSVYDSDIYNNVLTPSVIPTFDCELGYEPGLFESWTFNEDNTVLTVKLRQGVTWADGVPVTSKDVKFTYDLIADPLTASPRVANIERMVPDKRPLVIDDHTLEFHYTEPYNLTTMVAHAAFAVVPEHKLKDADRATLRGHPYGRDPVTSGPFVIEKWQPDASITLAPNPGYSGPDAWDPRLQKVVFKVIPEYPTRLVELENGSVDFMDQIMPVDADRLAQEHPEIKLYRRGWRSNDYVAWNQFDPKDYTAKQATLAEQREAAKQAAEANGEEPAEIAPLDWATVQRHRVFGDKAVRRALTKAMDIDKLISDLLTSKVTGEAYGRRMVSTITPSLCNVHNNDIATIPFDPAGAKAELAEAGWTDTDGDGILDKDGQPLSFTLLTNSGRPLRAKAAIIIQANLKAVGVDMQIEKLETNTFYERLRKKDYDAALGGWAAGLFVDMIPIWHSGEQYEFNFTGYSNPEVDALIKAALLETDADKSAEMFKQAQALIYEDQPYTFLFWRDEIVGVHSRFKDAKVDILSPLNQLNTWWVPGSEAKYVRR